MKYVCKTKCFIKGKLYKQDKFYEFAKEPNKHFEYVGAKAPVAKTGRPPGKGKALGIDSIV